MTNRFNDTQVFREQRFSIGVDNQTNSHFLAIPVANQMVDYEEYYCLSVDQFALFSKDVVAGAAFAERCRVRANDTLIILPPGTDRGEPL